MQRAASIPCQLMGLAAVSLHAEESCSVLWPEMEAEVNFSRRLSGTSSLPVPLSGSPPLLCAQAAAKCCAYHQLPQELLPQPPSDVLCPALARWTLTTRSQGQYDNRTRHSRVLVRTLDAVEYTPVLRICAVHGGVLSKKHKSRT